MRRDDDKPDNSRSQGPGPKQTGDDDIPIVGIIGQSDADFRPKTQRSIRRAGMSAMARARCDIMDPEALAFLFKALEYAELRFQRLEAQVAALERRQKRALWTVVSGDNGGT